MSEQLLLTGQWRVHVSGNVWDKNDLSEAVRRSLRAAKEKVQAA